MNDVKAQTSTSITSNSNSDISRNEIITLPLSKRICLVGSTLDDPETLRASHNFGVPVVTSKTGLEFLDNITCTTFVVDNFENSYLEQLQISPHRIIGSKAIQQLSQKKEKLPNNSRPLFNLAMQDVIVCFTGFRRKEDLTKLTTLVHHMGGSVRIEMAAKVTHLVANCCGGDKYQYATTFKVPVMSGTWITACWEQREDVTFWARAEDCIASHKLKPLHGARVCFFGFSSDEMRHVHDVLEANGGQVTQFNDPECTHVVVDEGSLTERPKRSPKALWVRLEWFWTSVQKAACADENEYLCYAYSLTRQSSKRAKLSGPARRKRILSLGRNDAPIVLKRRSSLNQESILNFRISPKKALLDQPETIINETAKKNLNLRHQIYSELVQTESNYVTILRTIITFKKQLEEMPEPEALLNKNELNSIFGKLPPILEIHSRMLNDLHQASSHWSEDTSVGKIILSYTNGLLNAYLPFVNFYEAMKDTLIRCDRSKPRFHAFLKLCQTKPECARQSLQELLIRPVQRLPSVSLLLNNILKHTSKTSEDYTALENALSALKEVITYINEDKGKQEGKRFTSTTQALRNFWPPWISK